MAEYVKETGKILTGTYWSLDEFANAMERPSGHGRTPGSFTDGATYQEAMKMVRYGWQEELDDCLRIAEEAVETAIKTREVPVFEPVWDVTGATVDIGRAIAGEPEDMIDFPPARTSKVGKVITLCASIAYSCAISADTIKRRGHTVVALALALDQLGHSTEIWVDWSIVAVGAEATEAHLRVCVKGPNDVIDPARIMFVFAHAAFLRQLVFEGWSKSSPEPWCSRIAHRMQGYPRPARQDLPEGTIYLPELRSSTDVPDAHTGLRNYLRELALLEEE